MFSESAGRLAGLAGLLFGWSPDTFWAATPAELAALARAAAGEGSGGAPMTLAELERLRARFPD